jgi:hypothetical protein
VNSSGLGVRHAALRIESSRIVPTPRLAQWRRKHGQAAGTLAFEAKPRAFIAKLAKPTATVAR